MSGRLGLGGLGLGPGKCFSSSLVLRTPFAAQTIFLFLHLPFRPLLLSVSGLVFLPLFSPTGLFSGHEVRLPPVRIVA
jgi:hypothetical protein